MLLDSLTRYCTLLACISMVYSPKILAHEYTFGVLPVRSAVLTAQVWNPILQYLSEKTGDTFLLRTERTGDASKQKVSEGAYDFCYTNHIFEPSVTSTGYRIFARPNSKGIQGKLIVKANSPLRSIQDLHDLSVGFPSQSAFVGYVVPQYYLQHQNIHVQAVFGGNQEGVMAQFKLDQIQAIAVNSVVLKAYAQREHFAYRTLWESEIFNDFPLCAHPRVATEEVKLIQKVLVAMSKDPKGVKILHQSALIAPELQNGFVLFNEKDYDNYQHYFTK